jgi:gas vesicle protein
MSKQAESSDASLVLGLIVGAAIGAGIAFILAPRSGQETREAIREQGLILRDRVQETTDSVRQKAADATGSAQASAEQTRDAVISRIQAPEGNSAGA